MSRDNYEQFVREVAQIVGVPQDLLINLISAESSWNENAKSPAGAIGLTQLMPATARELGVDPTVPEQNILGGALYLKQQLNRFGDIRHAVAAYNAGPGAVAQYGGVPPYEETIKYVNRVLGSQPRQTGASPTVPQEKTKQETNHDWPKQETNYDWKNLAETMSRIAAFK